jgi:hypothetical protein
MLLNSLAGSGPYMARLGDFSNLNKVWNYEKRPYEHGDYEAVSGYLQF